MKKNNTLVPVVILILILSGIGCMVYTDKVNERNAPQPESEGGSILCRVEQYGFGFVLPSSWKGYTVLRDTWDGYSLISEGDQELSEHGAKISIRHPLWTEEAPRQDIPVLIFTHDQWDRLQREEFHIGAAPLNPSELGRNGRYVFALPARYNFAFPEGFEEVDAIIKSGAFYIL